MIGGNSKRGKLGVITRRISNAVILEVSQRAKRKGIDHMILDREAEGEATQ